MCILNLCHFFFSSRRRHTRLQGDWSSDVCSSDLVIAKDGWRFHHLGIPTNVVRPGETHLPWLKVHVSGFESSPYGIQWMRFDKDRSEERRVGKEGRSRWSPYN